MSNYSRRLNEQSAMCLKTLLAAASLFLALALPGMAGANTIAYNNLGPNNSYSNVGEGGAWFGVCVGCGNYILDPAEQFTSTASGSLDSLTLGMSYDNAGINAVTLTLYSDNAGAIGDVLWSENFEGVLESTPDLNSSWGSPKPILQLNDLNGPMLSAGSTYWLGAYNDMGKDDWGFDYRTSIPGTVAEWGTFDNYVWDYFSGYDALAMQVGVNSSPVPEPSTLLLLGSGLLCLAGVARRKRKA